MVFDSDTLERALEDPQCVNVIVHACDDGRLVLDADPAAFDQRVDRLPGVGTPLKESLLICDVLTVGILHQELVWMVEVDHEPHRDVRIDLVKAIDHRKECVVEAVRIEGQLFGADTDGFGARLCQCCEPCCQLGIRQHHGVAA